MIIKEIDDSVWGQLFTESNAPFSREDVVEVKDLQQSPSDVNQMKFIGLFKLKDGSWGAVTGTYNPTYDAVEDAEAFKCEARMKEILFAFYKDECPKQLAVAA
ncbi:MAG: hypothetical protein KGI60_04470 [Patescibacteria group bacterium]|nr:hypothetical protein [Patescibacteria group bacterium]